MEYPAFTVNCGIDGAQYECRFRNLITGIAPRHSDTVDVEFMVNDKPATVALSLAALEEQRTRTGEALTDPEVLHISALALKQVLEKEGIGQDRMVVPSLEATIELAAKVHARARG
jgi:hypothetical protein